MKRAMLPVLLACLAALPSYAKPAKGKADTKIPKAVETSKALEISSAPATAEEVVKRFEAIDARIRSLKAKYLQTVHMEDTATTQTIEGTISYLKPDRLRIEHVRPERQTVVTDGKAIWVHRHSSNQVIHSELADWRKADPLTNSLLDFGSYASLAKRYDVSYASSTRVVTLAPREKGAEFKLRMTLAEGTWFPVDTELIVARMRVKTSLRDLDFNPDLAEFLFNFIPPAGADVFKNFKPPRLSP